MSDDLTRKAIVTFNGSYADGLTKALQAVVAMALEEAAKVVEFSPDSHTAREMQLMLDKAAAIRALKEKV